jgi:hypothetical protein
MEQDQNPTTPHNPLEDYQRQEDQRQEIIHDGMTIMAEKMADMMGVEDPEDRAKMVEGYRTMMAGPSRMPFGVPLQFPPVPRVTPQPCCTTTGPAGEIITMDWFCILQRTYKHTYYPATKTTKLVTYQGRVIDLDPAQTLHLVKYLDDLRKAEESQTVGGFNPYGNRTPGEFLSHPAIKELLGDYDGPSNNPAA